MRTVAASGISKSRWQLTTAVQIGWWMILLRQWRRGHWKYWNKVCKSWRRTMESCTTSSHPCPQVAVCDPPPRVSIKCLDSSCHSRSVFIERRQISLNIRLFSLHTYIFWSLEENDASKLEETGNAGALEIRVLCHQWGLEWDETWKQLGNVSGMRPHRTTEPMEVIQSMQQHPSRRPVWWPCNVLDVLGLTWSNLRELELEK